MHRGKGMKFVGDSRVPVARKPNIQKTILNTQEKQKHFGELLVKRMDGRCSFLIGYLCLTVAHPSLERMADPTDAGYIPLPDWYFLFLYQLLKYSYASGSFTVIGFYYARDCLWRITISSIS